MLQPRVYSPLLRNVAARRDCCLSGFALSVDIGHPNLLLSLLNPLLQGLEVTYQHPVDIVVPRSGQPAGSSGASPPAAPAGSARASLCLGLRVARAGATRSSHPWRFHGLLQHFQAGHGARSVAGAPRKSEPEGGPFFCFAMHRGFNERGSARSGLHEQTSRRLRWGWMRRNWGRGNLADCVIAAGASVAAHAASSCAPAATPVARLSASSSASPLG